MSSQRRRRAALSLLVVPILGAGWMAGAPAVSAQTSPDRHVVEPGVGAIGAEAPTPSNVASAVRFRSSIGLRSDRPYITSLFNDRLRGGGEVLDYGTVLTPGEEADVLARQRVDRYVSLGSDSPFSHYLEAHSSDFAGEWIDQQAGGVVHVLFTSNVAQHRRELIALFPWPSSLLSVGGGTASWGSLTSAVAALAHTQTRLAAEGIALVEVAPDAEHNRLDVGLEQVTPGAADAIEAVAMGIPVALTQVARPSAVGTQDPLYPPMRGGLGMYEDNADGTATACTTGFVLNGPTNQWGGDNYVTTAGHCGPVGTVWFQGSASAQNGVAVGQSIIVQNGQNNNDLAVIPLPNGVATNSVAISDYSCGLLCTGVNVRLISSQDTGNGTVGTVTCMSGAWSGGEMCGTIRSVNVCAQAQGGPLLCNLNTANYVAVHGDSGGSVYQPQTNGTSIAQGSATLSDLTSTTWYEEITPSLAAAHCGCSVF